MKINFRDLKTQKMVIVVALSVTLVYVYFNYIYTGRTQVIADLKTEYTEKQDLLDRGKRVAQNFQNVQEDFQHLLNVWETAQTILPTEKIMEQLLKDITLAGQKNGVTFLLFKPLSPVERDYYFEHPIQIKTSSNYHQLGRFLSKIATLERIVNINKMNLTTIRPRKNQPTRDTVQGNFEVVIYVFKEFAAQMKPPQI